MPNPAASPSKLVPSLLPLLVAALLAACGGDAGPAPDADAGSGTAEAGVEAGADPHSFARPEEVAVEHVDLDLDVDFEARKIAGRASLRVANPGGHERLHLDTRDLDVLGVYLDDGVAAEYELGPADPFLGRALVVEIAPDTEVVHVDYATRPGAAALQWLEPAQTAGEHPFLFTQSQAILARTWVPCQDTPAVRFTYDATVRVPPELLALMSAENPTELAADGVYRFEMPQPIPSYLLALAVGELELRPLGPRSGVYAEPTRIEAAAWEFAQIEAMIDATEELYGPYRWERYDILVLPPSFPFGGMENPRLTFLTPTILAGDRSLVALVAHELAHSWSGNLVTNATWNDFWLNEGFTTYLERRIMEAIEGEEYADMLALLGLQDLEEEIQDLGPQSADTHLHLELTGRDPDAGMTNVAYEKGAFFLRRLEEVFGRERFDDFLRTYFDAHAFESLTTDEFVAYLRGELLDPNPELAARVDVDGWIHQPGIPEEVPAIESAAFARVEAELADFLAGTPADRLETAGWNTHQWLHFLRGLPDELEEERMAALDDAFGFTDTGNSEILHAWLHHVVASDYQPGYPALESFLTGMGRRKFLRPLYRRLAETEEGLARARAIYAQARPGYHPLSQQAVDEILGQP